MKTTIKYFICILVFTYKGYCQNDYTILSESVYNTIKFHDVFFTDIKATNGNTAQMASLFPVDQSGNTGSGLALNHTNDVTIEEFGQDIGEHVKCFKYHSGLNIYFGNDDTDPDLEVIRVDAKKITINGISLEIGDPISNLTSVNYTIANGKSIQLVKVIRPNGYATPLSIRLDSNQQITEIVYYINP